MTISDTATKITILKHLHDNRSFDQTAAFTRTTVEQVRQVAQAHGYPNRENLAQAIARLEEKAADEGSDLTHKSPAEIPAARTGPRLATTSPSSVTDPDARPVGKPDEIRVLINTAKGHPAKRIQAQADRVLDAIGKLRQLVADDEQQHAARRAAEAEKTAARAEVERLQAQLAEAKAKLRPTTSSTPRAAGTPGDGPTAADIRAWARDQGLDCPSRGVLPQAIRDAYATAHTTAA